MWAIFSKRFKVFALPLALACWFLPATVRNCYFKPNRFGLFWKFAFALKHVSFLAAGCVGGVSSTAWSAFWACVCCGFLVHVEWIGT
eukprot:m.75439 g.75439  ORF g.75439 m.75439 type:complete len:87 (+) comp50397_c0_seq1:96-356(+)